MHPNNVRSTLLLGNNLDYILFKAAIKFAECGLHIWFISPEAFEKIPDIQPPDKEILQLITFVYFKDYRDLIAHLNGLHLWHKVPNIIILSGFEIYSRIYSEEYNSTISALISTTLLDSASVCARKGQKEAYLIIACPHPPEIYKCRLQVLYDMYFPHMVNNSDESVLESIINYYSNK